MSFVIFRICVFAVFQSNRGARFNSVSHFLSDSGFMYSSSINMSYISLEPFLFLQIYSIKDGLQGRGATPSILRSSGQVDRTASSIFWNVVNGGVKLYFSWKSYKVMKSPLFVKRSWINVIPESCHFLIKMGLLSILMKQLCQSGDYQISHQNWWDIAFWKHSHKITQWLENIFPKWIYNFF